MNYAHFLDAHFVLPFLTSHAPLYIKNGNLWKRKVNRMSLENAVANEKRLEALREAANHDHIMKDLCSFEKYIRYVEWFCSLEANPHFLEEGQGTEPIADAMFLLSHVFDVYLNYRIAVQDFLQDGQAGFSLKDVPMDREIIAGELKQFVLSAKTRNHRIAVALRSAIGIEVMEPSAFAVETTYSYLTSVVEQIARDNTWSAWSDCLLALVMLPDEEKRQQASKLFIQLIQTALMQEDRRSRVDLLKIVMRYSDL
jgi:hypothetical protein